MTVREEISQFKAFALPQAAREYPAAFRRWRQVQDDCLAAAPDSDRIRVAVLGFSTLASLEPFLETSLLGAGMVCETHIGGYNQFFQDALDPTSGLYAFAPDLTFVLCPLEDLLEAEDRRLDHLPAERRRGAVESAIARLCDALDAIRSNSSTALLVSNMCRPDRAAGGFADLGRPGSVVDVFAGANRTLADHVAGLPNAYLFDLEGLFMRVGLREGLDPRNRFIGDVRFSNEALVAVACQIAWLAAAFRGKTKKCLVLDLDDTLWGGTVGEDGVGGLRIDDDPLGRPFRAFQETVLDLHHKGIILALCSKNNEEDAREAFERRAMPLSLDQFAAMRINWDDKASNIVSLSEELNIGLDSMVFLDNSPTERAWVSARLPDVLVPDLPELPSLRPDFLRWMPVFDRLSLTAEDRRRSTMYVQQRQRREFEGTVSRDDFLRQLNLTVTVLQDPKASLGRLAQLTQRTNQFNLTTRRYTEADVEGMLVAPDASVVAIKAEDRFGDYGVVGLAMVRMDGRERALIDTFLLSCRVIGKDLESVLLQQVAAWAKGRGCRTLVGRYVPSPKNRLVKDLYPRYGFTPAGDDTFALDLTRTEPQVPDFINVA